MEDFVFLLAIIGVTWIDYAWETYLSTRQRRIYQTQKNLPDEMTSIMTHEDFTKARLYAYDKSSFSLLSGIYQQTLNTCVLYFGVIAILWSYCAELLNEYGYASKEYEITCTCLFMLVGGFISQIMDIPWTVYSTFVIEERHGFNKQTAGFFIKDTIKKFILGQVLNAVIISALIFIIRWGGDQLFLYCWLFVLFFSMALITIYPDYIAPLFDKFEPLRDGELKTKIEDLAARLSFPLTKLYVVEGSKRSSHSNAYFYGFFKNKRIVLFDTLLLDYELESADKLEKTSADKQEETTEPETKHEEKKTPEKKKGCTDDEVVAVLAHELGHWSYSHVLKNFVIMQANVLLLFAGFQYLFKNSQLYTSFGFYDEQPVIIGFYVIFSFIYAPYNTIVGFLTTVWSRRCEFQADQFAAELGYTNLLQSGLIKLTTDNLSFPVVDWLYSAWSYSHPPVMDRLNALKKYQ